MDDIKIVIKGAEYTIDEARTLYIELSKMFKEKEYLPYIPYPQPYQDPAIPIGPYYTTGPGCSE